MNIVYNTIKYTGLLSNLLYMMLAIGIMSGAGLGLQMAEPNTPEHTYFIESIVLGASICIIVIFGCYGLVCNLLSVNIIFTCFILIVLGVEYIQVRSYQPHTRYSSALRQLDHAWYRVGTQPQLMQQYEAQQHCCGYNNAADYQLLHMQIPASCYQPLKQKSSGATTKLYTRGCLASLDSSQRYIQRRDKVFMWFIVGLELFILTQTIALSILLYKLRQQQRRSLHQVPPGVRREPRANHVNSRTPLLLAQEV
ncbi:protein late bloomer [Scaptodrosophila lebanonensis]|uniref:Protein late bloomer n=1 Tax=Drosophila lebanonensis TaxID=7225 RepID=A0A6J2TJE7_DROLE|nr:protein late bloomer [Scaptodrosophila lebanonensis]